MIKFTVNDDSLDGVTLENFPVLVRLSTSISGFAYSDFLLSSGADMLFTDARKNAVYSQVDTWNPDGESLVWVVLPEATKGTDARVWGCQVTHASRIIFQDDLLRLLQPQETLRGRTLTPRPSLPAWACPVLSCGYPRLML